MSLWGCWVFLSCRTKVTELSLHQKGFQEEEEEGTGHVGRDLQRAPADGCPAEPRLTAVCELSWAACVCLPAHPPWAWDLWQRQCLSQLAALLPLRAAGGRSAEAVCAFYGSPEAVRLLPCFLFTPSRGSVIKETRHTRFRMAWVFTPAVVLWPWKWGVFSKVQRWKLFNLIT